MNYPFMFEVGFGFGIGFAVGVLLIISLTSLFYHLGKLTARYFGGKK